MTWHLVRVLLDVVVPAEAEGEVALVVSRHLDRHLHHWWIPVTQTPAPAITRTRPDLYLLPRLVSPDYEAISKPAARGLVLPGAGVPGVPADTTPAQWLQG